MYGSGSDDSDGEDHEGITSLPSYLAQHNSKIASNNSLNNLNTLTGVPGVWEKHTKLAKVKTSAIIRLIFMMMYHILILWTTFNCNRPFLLQGQDLEVKYWRK